MRCNITIEVGSNVDNIEIISKSVKKGFFLVHKLLQIASIILFFHGLLTRNNV